MDKLNNELKDVNDDIIENITNINSSMERMIRELELIIKKLDFIICTIDDEPSQTNTFINS